MNTLHHAYDCVSSNLIDWKIFHHIPCICIQSHLVADAFSPVEFEVSYILRENEIKQENALFNSHSQLLNLRSSDGTVCIFK